MNSGLYTAYSGMKAQSDALDILANNLANANTTGFKEEKAFFSELERSIGSSSESGSLNAAMNSPVQVNKALDMTEGSLTLTSRDLDIAIAGNGFLVVDAPQGIRYTRNGSLKLNAQSFLSTSEGLPVLGASGKPIKLGPGKIAIGEDGQVSLEGQQIDRLKIVTFDNLSTLEKEGQSLFLSRKGRGSEKPSDASVKPGYLEQSNVNSVSSIVSMIQMMRHFEAIQKSVTLMMNDINTKAIEKLGR